MEEEISREGQTNKEKEEAYRVKKRTIDLLPDADNNIAKLQVKTHLLWESGMTTSLDFMQDNKSCCLNHKL